MDNYTKIIDSFLQVNNLTTDNKHILGVLFYGSRSYNVNDKNSDIDLLIVTDRHENYKGVSYVDEIKVEYFEKSIYDLIEKMDMLEENNSLVSIFTNGMIIFSKNQTLEWLKEEILSRKNTLKKPKKKKVNTTVINEFLDVFNSLKENNNFFDYIFHNLIESIRKIYHKENGYPPIPSMKTYKLYTDNEYATKYYCTKIPKQVFVDMYLDLTIEGYNEIKFKSFINKITLDDTNFKGYKLYKKSELIYESTTVANYVSRLSEFLKCNHPLYLHYYYITLEKIRILYCNINDLDDSIVKFGCEYDTEFLYLFEKCLNNYNSVDNIERLFCLVVEKLNIDYRQYKVLDYSK